jgi:hypothetical protein
LAAGTLSDALRPVAGEESLRYALLALCPGYLWAGWYLWQAGRTVMRDLESTRDCTENVGDVLRVSMDDTLVGSGSARNAM